MIYHFKKKYHFPIQPCVNISLRQVYWSSLSFSVFSRDSRFRREFCLLEKDRTRIRKFSNQSNIFTCLILALHSFYSFANTDQASPPQPNAVEQLFPFLLIGVFFYFILIRPQQKKLKKQGDFLSKIKRGDEVLTNSGIYGRIEGLTESFVILEVAENVRIRIAKSQIASYTEDSIKQQQNKLNKK